MKITNYRAKCNRFNHQTRCAGAFQCTACTKCLQRDSRSIRNASPVVGAAKDEELKGLPSAYGVFLFLAIASTPEGTHDLAAHNPVDCQNCQCFARGVALFLLLSGHFVFPSSSSSLCSLFFSQAAVSPTFFHAVLQFH